MPESTGNYEFVAALVHGRRSGMAEGTRLRRLCQAQNLAELSGQLMTAPVPGGTSGLQRKLMTQWADEIERLARYVAGPAAEFLLWLGVRRQVENVKVFIRRLATKAPLASATPHLVATRVALKMGEEALAKAESLNALISSLPAGPLRHALARAANVRPPSSFFLEGALDQAYHAECLRKTMALAPCDRVLVQPLVMQDADIFHLMLVTRGKLMYHLEAEKLLRLHIPGTRIPRSALAAMLAESDLGALGPQLRGRALDADCPAPGEGADIPGDAGRLERLAWRRFQRLASRAFRRSDMDLATVVAYIQLRRIEVMNLTAISEGVRRHIPSEDLSARLLPGTTTHV